ncbi:MAG TPA: type II toxin-antitoxin system MqsA family antitoxin [Xanthomonadaceae bacterium]|jgi:HTH-type transcriptional regulator/antitoxin MqsA|nr:type II toxin-antitoxin system MqsA family antitoxin [Xanthomonadaceae bacterium]
MSNTHECALCGASAVHATTYSDTFIHRGVETPVDGLEVMRCDACGAELIEADQARRNYRKMVDIGRTIDGLLTGDAIVNLRKRLGLTQQEAAELFGGGPNAFSKYERGDVVQSVAMDRLLRLVGSFPLSLDLLRAIARPKADLNQVADVQWIGASVISATPDKAITLATAFPNRTAASNVDYAEFEAA